MEETMTIINFKYLLCMAARTSEQCLMLVMSDCGAGAMCGMPSQDMGHIQAPYLPDLHISQPSTLLKPDLYITP